MNKPAFIIANLPKIEKICELFSFNERNKQDLVNMIVNSSQEKMNTKVNLFFKKFKFKKSTNILKIITE